MNTTITQDDINIGAGVETDVYSIGGRVERARGTVLEVRRGGFIVRTELHGELFVETTKARLVIPTSDR